MKNSRVKGQWHTITKICSLCKGIYLLIEQHQPSADKGFKPIGEGCVYHSGQHPDHRSKQVPKESRGHCTANATGQRSKDASGQKSKNSIGLNQSL